MGKVRIIIDGPLMDGHKVTFKAPCNCTQVDALDVRYIKDGTQSSKLFTMKDTHGSDLTDLGNLFTKGAYVHVILDTQNGFAYLQNADTNSYLEERLAAAMNTTRTNLLINGDFRVWRSGTEFGITGNNLPVADKWFVRRASAETSADGYVKKVANGMSVEVRDDEVQLSQYLNYPFKTGLAYTLSLKINGKIERFHGVGGETTWSADEMYWLKLFGSDAYVTIALNTPQVGNKYDGENIIEWVKLEEGNTATDFCSRLYEEELLLCMADELTSPDYENGNTVEY